MLEDELLELEELEELDEEELELEDGGVAALELELELEVVSQPAKISVKQTRLAGTSPAGFDSFFICLLLPNLLIGFDDPFHYPLP